MSIAGRKFEAYYLLLGVVLLEFFELETVTFGGYHHLFDASVFTAYFLLLRLLNCPGVALWTFAFATAIAWTLDLLKFRWQPVDIEGVFWFIAHGCIGYALIRSLFSNRKITDREIVGAISLFLIIGIVFANAYDLILWRNPGGLISSVSPTVTYDQVLYYSFMTQATVGYGDIIPGHRLVRVLSVLQAITGVMYIAVLISWFVSAHFTHHANHFLPPNK